jgi:hypothetical protein
MHQRYMFGRLFGVPCIAMVLSASAALAAEAAPTSQTSAASLRIQSVRINRAQTELQKNFANRYGSDGSGVQLQLLLTFKDASVLPVARDAVSIDTFVDDTYQNLLGSERSGYSYQNQPIVSEDGSMVVFTVSSNKPIAEDAGRVFVRGTLAARMARGEVKTATGNLPLNAGQEVTIGGFRTTLRSISDNSGGSNTRGSVTLALSVEGDAARIRKVRALSTDGKPLNDERGTRFSERTRFADRGSAGQPSTLYVNLGPGPQPARITLEYGYVEKVESVKIPFEAQVDLGVTKVSAPQPSGEPDRASAARTRAWPPPPTPVRAAAEFPARRAPFDPTTRPAEKAKLARAAVDLFSLTIGKPAPGEAAGVKWSNPPAEIFRASGFTLARLMISTPDATILSFAPGGVTLSKFEDDKGVKHATEVYPEKRQSGYGPAPLWTSPDGQQALLTISLTDAPSPGATRCTLAGTVQATVARNERAEESAAIPLLKDQSFHVGPFQGTLAEVRQSPPLSPAQPAGSIEVYVRFDGPVSKIRSVELVNSVSKQVLAERRDLTPGSDEIAPSQKTLMWPMYLHEVPTGPILVRVRHYDRAEVVEIPFDVTTGIGL